ncbi:MAG: hypothetical protein ACXADX_13375 [Candidatus Hodarchaeales archaeon]|jgi:hypothetical protein
MKQLIVVNVGSIDGRAYLHPEDLKSLDIDPFDYLQLKNEFEDWGACQILSSEEVERGTIAVDSSVLDGANIGDGDQVEVSKAEVAEAIVSLRLGVEPMAGQEPETVVLYIAEHFDELAGKLRNRPMFNGLSIGWTDAGCGAVRIRFLESQPKLEEETVGIIDPSGREVQIDIVPSTEMSFNAVLVLDVSGSMGRKDMLVKNIAGAVEGLKRGLADSPELAAILDEYQDGTKVSRIKAAALATMLFLSLKISKGWGEQVTVFSFAGEVDQFKIQDPEKGETPVIKCVGETKKAGIEAILEYVVEKCSSESGLTFLSGSIKEAYESLEFFEINPVTGQRNPTMIVVLTDGAPNKGGDLGVNPIPIVKEMAANYPDSVLYTIGLGEADHLLLKAMAEIGRGSNLPAADLGELWKYYDSLAQNFQMAIKTSMKD